jgi:hypothetical protein
MKKNRIIGRYGSVLRLATAALPLIAGASGIAQANSRLEVTNYSSIKLRVQVFNGDDAVCTLPNTVKIVSPYGHETMGCAGGGNHRCKVKIEAPYTSGKVCGNADLYGSCKGRTINVPDNAVLIISRDYTNCWISAP